MAIVHDPLLPSLTPLPAGIVLAESPVEVVTAMRRPHFKSVARPHAPRSFELRALPLKTICRMRRADTCRQTFPTHGPAARTLGVGFLGSYFGGTWMM